jgi:hypothetical protein
VKSVLDLLRGWEASGPDPLLDDGSPSLILYLGAKLYRDYEPDNLLPFVLRLEKWLKNVATDADKKTLLSLLSHVFFAGKGEFDSLYRSAMTIITRWVMDQESIGIEDPQFEARCAAELASTWFCPITDSMRINSFLKINGLTGHDHRPHWRSLTLFGDPMKIDRYVHLHGIKRLVLLEDFVGSGSQVKSTVEFASAAFPNLQILVLPLIVCPTGDETLVEMTARLSSVTYRTPLLLPASTFLQEVPTPGEPPIFARGRDLIARHLVRLGQDPFGYGRTGAMVALMSNCPDNTLSIFRQESADWSPLFPRIWRPE